MAICDILGLVSTLRELTVSTLKELQKFLKHAFSRELFFAKNPNTNISWELNLLNFARKTF